VKENISKLNSYTQTPMLGHWLLRTMKNRTCQLSVSFL